MVVSVEDALDKIVLGRPPQRLDTRKRRYSWAYHKSLCAASSMGLDKEAAGTVARLKARKIAGGGEVA